MDRLIGVGYCLSSCPSVYQTVLYVLYLTYVHTVQFAYLLYIFLASITPKWHEHWPPGTMTLILWPWMTYSRGRLLITTIGIIDRKAYLVEIIYQRPCLGRQQSSEEKWTKKPMRVWTNFKVLAPIITVLAGSKVCSKDSNTTNNTLWPSGQTVVFSRHSGFYPQTGRPKKVHAYPTPPKSHCVVVISSLKILLVIFYCVVKNEIVYTN